MKTQISIKGLLLTILICLTYSCNKDMQVPTVSYQEDLIPIISTFCSGTYCHATITHFEEYLNIKEVADNGKLWDKLIVERSMPPSGGGNVESETITEDERRLFATWIEEGALNN